jgi:serine/threonine protein kinase
MLTGRYRIIGRLGRGGMGEVYRADDLTLGQPVALKFLPAASVQDSAFIERFRAEVRNARGVSHPNVCRVYDIGEVNGEQFISMEYVDGEDLATLLRRIGRLPPAKALEIARQLCAGLAAAHDKGVLHRDLKPANIMIDGQGRARITDFGLAVTSEEAATDGQIAGTPAYMAPEQLAGRGATAKSDIYALGLVLYEVFTGKKAFEGATLAELRREHADVQPKALSSHITDVDPAVERVILRCLEKDPKLRPASALAVAAAIAGGETEGFEPRTARAASSKMLACSGSY